METPPTIGRVASVSNSDVTDCPRRSVLTFDPKNTMKTFPLFLVVVGLLIGCGKDPLAIDVKDYDNDLTEEVFRFQFDRYPHDSKDIAHLVVWGYKVTPVPVPFVNRFEDLDYDVVSFSDVNLTTNLTLRLKKDANGVATPLATFQVVHLAPDDDGRKTIEVAWTYKDQSRREIVAVDESQAGSAKFSVIREIPAFIMKKTEPTSSTNPPSAPLREDR